MRISFLSKAAKPAPPPIAEAIGPEDMDEEERATMRLMAQHELKYAIAMRDRVLIKMATSAR